MATVGLARAWRRIGGVCVALLLASACAPTKPPAVASAAGTAAPAPVAAAPVVQGGGRVIPSSQLERRAQEEGKAIAGARAAAIANAAAAAAARPAPAAKKPEGPTIPTGPAVWLYVSLSSQAYFMKAGLDGSVRSLVWESFLRKYKIPYVRTTSVELLEQVPAHSVLLIPSAPALSERETAAIRGARERGVSVLSTWLTGVRDEAGEWRGFDFMDKVLGVRVAGNTEDAEDDNFMIVHGNNPVLHALPAGNRVWLERAKEYWPLRLVGRNEAANMTNWGREYAPDKPTGVIVFDEQKQGSGAHSRNVVLGYPEQLWLSADPKHLEAIAHNALGWLFRQADAYLSYWPHPYQSGFVAQIEAGEDVAEVDFEFAKRLESVGARGSYFVLSDSLSRAAPVIKRIQRRGHEIGYFGDKFEGFKDQGQDTQAKRMDAMQKGMEEAGIKLGPQAGFVAPMSASDDTTRQLLLERRFGHYVAFMDATEARLPFFPKGSTDVNSATVVLPRTQPGPEEATEEGDPDEGMQHFLGQLSLSEAMGGLSMIRIPTQTILAQEHQDLLFDHLKANKGRVWMSTAADVAQWWRERAKITSQLEFDGERPLLVVTVYGSEPVRNPAAVWVNLPRIGARLRLQSLQADNPTPAVAPMDAWRAAVLLQDLDPGEYRWYLQFEPGTAGQK
ncbi:MAG: polysaccharide deacetylase family protein [Rhodoferax sp.]